MKQNYDGDNYSYQLLTFDVDHYVSKQNWILLHNFQKS